MPREAANALLSLQLKPVQVGMVNDRAFLVNASVGLYPELLQDREEYKRQYGRHRSVAMWAGMKTLLREHRQLLVEVEHEQGSEHAAHAEHLRGQQRASAGAGRAR